MEITRSVQLTFINYYLLEILSILYFVKGQCRHKECQNCFSEIIITLYDHQVWSYYTCTHIGGEERYCFLVEMSKVKITMIQCEQSVLRRTYIEFNTNCVHFTIDFWIDMWNVKVKATMSSLNLMLNKCCHFHYCCKHDFKNIFVCHWKV